MTSFTFYKVLFSVVASLNLTGSFLFPKRGLLCGRELKLDQFFSFYKVLKIHLEPSDVAVWTMLMEVAIAAKMIFFYIFPNSFRFLFP